MTDPDWVDSKPSPRCGRIDDHPGHWHGKASRRRWCPGPPTITKAEREAKLSPIVRLPGGY